MLSVILSLFTELCSVLDPEDAAITEQPAVRRGTGEALKGRVSPGT